MKRPRSPEDEAFRAGADAAYDGRGIADCPHADERLAEAWRAGWRAVFQARLGWAPPRDVY